MIPRKLLEYTLNQLLIVSLVVLKVESYKCHRLPSDLKHSEQTKSNDGRFVLEIEGKPEKYRPNERYQVTLKVDHYQFSSLKFNRFLLGLESRQNPDSSEHVTHDTGKFELSSGSFAKHSYSCPNTVEHENTQQKKQITVTWIAPPPNSGCVTIKATVIETSERWYTDDDSATDGHLTKTLCEDFEENEDLLPPVLDYCCACEEAKYEMAFQGNWIRNNHPKGFPADLFTTKFSDIVGASHRKGYTFWNDHEEPSPGLQELAFNGSTKSLEMELMNNITNLHTIIKARGLAYPNITSSSYAVFRVDNQNHLVSVVAKMMPSPDWIVGIPGMELCMSNCSWKQSRTINLYPRDVGIDDALEYIGSIPSRNPNPKITEITSKEPADVRSPFYDENGEQIKPIAKLHFKLEKVYKKDDCDPDQLTPEPKEEEDTTKEQSREEMPSYQAHYSSPPAHFRSATREQRDSGCEVAGWSKWSTCSVQCGKGHMTRNVIFKNDPGQGCQNVIREETQECQAECESGETEMHICSNIFWTPWTPCSVTCGKGKKYRYRYLDRNEQYDPEDFWKQCVNKETVECEEKGCL